MKTQSCRTQHASARAHRPLPQTKFLIVPTLLVQFIRNQRCVWLLLPLTSLDPKSRAIIGHRFRDRFTIMGALKPNEGGGLLLLW